jgi:hypothetical protein
VLLLAQAVDLSIGGVEAANKMVVPFACSHASSWRRGLSSSAGRAAYGPAPGSGSSHPRSTLVCVPADSDTVQRWRPVSQRSEDRC